MMMIYNLEKMVRENKKDVNFKILQAYKISRKKYLDYINFDEVIWEKEAAQIYHELKDNGVDRFTITISHGNVLNVIYKFLEQGAEIVKFDKFRSGKTCISLSENREYEEVKSGVLLEIK